MDWRLRALTVVLLATALLLPATFAPAQPASKQDLQLLVELLNRRFEDVNKRFEDVNKRFDDINKRFDDVNKRFEMLMWFIGVLMAIATGVNAYVVGRVRKQEERLEQAIREEHSMNLDAFVRALATADAQTKKRIKEALR